MYMLWDFALAIRQVTICVHLGYNSSIKYYLLGEVLWTLESSPSSGLPVIKNYHII